MDNLVRPIVTLSLVGATIYLAILGVLSPDAVKDLAITAVAFWFGSRGTEKYVANERLAERIAVENERMNERVSVATERAAEREDRKNTEVNRAENP